MAINFTTTMAGGSADYQPYLWGELRKTDRYNDSTLLDFGLVAGDANFVTLSRGAYITVNTSQYGKWFTGYVVTDPERVSLGKQNGVTQYGYKYKATSDEYALNLNPIGILPPFMNTTMGQILKFLADRLAPGEFDTSNIGPGVYIAQYVIDPAKRFQDVVKDFCTSASYRFWAKDHALHFERMDTTLAGIKVDGNDKLFTPSDLTVQPSADPIINDVTVLGGTEPQEYFNEYFVGSGVDAQFALSAGVYGVDRFVLLDEGFSSSSIDLNKWIVNDTVANYLQVSGGYLNCLGGPSLSSLVNLQSFYAVPLDGTVRFTHGEWDFLQPNATSANHGVICGIWSAAPANDNLACIYGLQVYHDGAGLLNLRPITDGSVDNTQSVPVSTSKRYVIRTIATAHRMHRLANTYSYTSQDGSINVYGGGAQTDTCDYQTFVVEIDPTTGATSNTFVLTNNAVPLFTNACYASYFPVASYDLHATVTGITISIPLQVRLEQQKRATDNTYSPTGYNKQLIGPNEIDSQDGTAPVATVVQANTGSATTATYSGTRQYNPGQAQLTYFKDSVQQKATLPQPGELVHVAYRAAGAAHARVQNASSILQEATAWGDNGIRALVRSDIKPRPRNSAECELAAAAIVGDNGYQHYQGVYNVYSSQCTSEPVSGQIMKFTNLPSGLPSQLQAEEITEVVSSIVSTKPVEVYKHQVSFGAIDHLRRFIGQFDDPAGIFEPDDQASASVPMMTYAAGNQNAFADDVVAPILNNWDTTNYYINTQQDPPSGGGFEVRFTDDSWGADDAKNLIARTSSRTITVPRNARNKVVFIRGYDVRNKLTYSEDFSQSWVASSCTVTSASGRDPNNNQAQLSKVTAAGNFTLTQTTTTAAASLQAVFSVSVKGSGTIQLVLSDGGSQTVTSSATVLTGGWQRLSVFKTFSGSGGILTAKIQSTAGTASTFSVTRASLETGTLTETVYAKTNAVPYGATSRRSSGIHVAFPLLPASPTGSMDYSDPKHPVISVTLPDLLQDVWGIEIRASDNVKVLSHVDLATSGLTPTWTDPGATLDANGNLTYYVYTYNLLGEFCANSVKLTNSDDTQLTLGEARVYNAPPDSAGNQQVEVTIAVATLPSNSQWDRLNVYLRAPADAPTLLGSATGDNTSIGTVSQLTNFVLKGTLFYGTDKTNVIAFTAPAPGDDEYWKVIVIPASPTRESTSAQVSKTFQVKKPAKPGTTGSGNYWPDVIGLTYTLDQSTNPSVPAGIPGDSRTASSFRQTVDGAWQWRVTLNWTNAENDPRYSQITSYEIYRQEPDGTEVHVGSARYSDTTWHSDWAHFPDQKTKYSFFVVTFGGGGKHNVVSSSTPVVTFTIELPGPEQLQSDITQLSVTAKYGYDTSGNFDYILYPVFNKPNSPSFAAAAILGEIPEGSGNFVLLGASIQGDGSASDALYLPKAKYPTAVQTWGLYAVSIDVNGKPKYPLNAKPVNAPYFALTTTLPPPPQDVTALTASASYVYNAAGHFDLIAHVTYSLGPPDPPRGGVQVWLRTAAGEWYSFEQSGLSGGVDFKFPIAKNIAPKSADETWDFYAVPYDRLNNFKYPINTAAHDPGNAAHVTAVIPAPLTGNPVGQEYAAFITGFSLLKDNYGVTLEGLENHGMTFTWNVPTDPRVQSVSIQAVVGSNDPHEIASAAAASGKVTSKPHVIPYNGSWTIYCVSVDASGRQNTITTSTPKIVHGVTAQTTGKLDATRLDPAKLNSTDLAIDAVNQQLKINSVDLGKILPSSINTPEFKIVGGKLTINGLDFSKAISSTLSSDLAVLSNQLAIAQVDLTKAKLNSYSGEFQFNAGSQFAIAYINASKINVGTLGAGVIYAGTIAADKITAGTLTSGVIYAGSIAASQIAAGTISAAITLTSPSLVITSGTVTVNIDGSNYLQMRDSSTNITASVTPAEIKIFNASTYYTKLIATGSVSGNGAGGTWSLSSNGLTFSGTKVVGGQQPAIQTVDATLGSTYTSSEQTKIHNAILALNSLIAAMNAHGLIATPAGGFLF